MKVNKYSIIQIILWIVTLLILNSGAIFLLVATTIDVDISTLTADESYSKTVRYLIKILKQQSQITGEPAYLTYWQLLSGWKAMLVYLSIGIGAMISAILIFKFTIKWIHQNKDKINAKKDELLDLKKYFILKTKMENNQLSDKDIEIMEKELNEF